MAANPTATATTSQSLPVVMAIGFLKSIGAPVTQNNIDNYIRWGNTESGGKQAFGGWNNYNPLNIVAQSGDNSTGQGGTQGNIANFGDPTTGTAAAARLFTGNPNAAPIIQAFRSNGSTQQLSDAINQFYATWDPGTTFSITGASAAPQTVTGSGQPTAQTTSSPLGDIGAFLLSPALGIASIFGGKNPLDGLTAGTGAFLGILSNWRYITEVIAGLLLVLLGIFLIARDTGAYARAKHTAGQAAIAGAAA